MTTTFSVRSAAAVLTAAAGGVHLGVIGEHAAEWWVAGAFFGTAGVAQLTCAGVMAITGATKRVAWFAVGVNMLLTATWLASRTVGVPFGPHAGVAEGASFLDLTAVFLQVVAVFAVVGFRFLKACPASAVGGPAATFRRLGSVAATATVLATVVALGPVPVHAGPHAEPEDGPRPATTDGSNLSIIDQQHEQVPQHTHDDDKEHSHEDMDR